MRPVFSYHIVFMARVDHIIYLHIFIDGGSNEANRVLLYNHGILQAMDQQ